jgi:hypothetical protein
MTLTASIGDSLPIVIAKRNTGQGIEGRSDRAQIRGSYHLEQVDYQWYRLRTSSKAPMMGIMVGE